MTGSLLIVLMRGEVNMSHKVKTTLTNLRLHRRFAATMIPDTPPYRGMVRKVMSYTSWCIPEPQLVLKLLSKRGRREGDQPLTDGDAKALGFAGLDDLAQALCDAKVSLDALKDVKPFFRLHPPRKGFRRSSRRMYTQGGLLGENPGLPKIVEAML